MNEHAIVFNGLKHHVRFIRSFIQIQSQRFDRDQFLLEIKKLGESQMDMYFGPLSVEEIYSQIIDQLKEKKLLEVDCYKQWLEEQNGFASIILSDGSVWILRMGIDESYYIHIHPGRHSPNTCRVKASVLKTAIAAIVYSLNANKEISIESINKVRQQWLDLAPLKSLSGEGIVSMIGMLREK